MDDYDIDDYSFLHLVAGSIKEKVEEEELICSICLCDFGPEICKAQGRKTILNSCKDFVNCFMHKNCMEQHFESRIDESKFPIGCPREECGAKAH